MLVEEMLSQMQMLQQSSLDFVPQLFFLSIRLEDKDIFKHFVSRDFFFYSHASSHQLETYSRVIHSPFLSEMEILQVCLFFRKTHSLQSYCYHRRENTNQHLKHPSFYTQTIKNTLNLHANAFSFFTFKTIKNPFKFLSIMLLLPH